MPQTEEEYRKTFESEKARTVILLGFLSMILTVRVLLHEGDFWNFPWWCDNNCPHFTVWLVPTFTNWIILWFGYIVCMLIYVSEDRFDKYSWSRTVRELARRVGTRFFILWYPLTLLFFSGFGGLSFQLPDVVQAPYWLTVTLLFAAYLLWTAEGMLGTKIVGKRGALTRAVDYFLDISREGTQIFAETLVHLWRGLLTKARHPRTGPIDRKKATRAFLLIIELPLILFAYFIEHLSGYDLLYVVIGPLYALIIGLAIIGFFRRRKRGSTKNSEASLA